MIGVVIDGLAPGIALDLDHIRKRMEQRKAKGRISTQRHEADEFHIVSGWFEGRTTGTPLTILIANTNTRSQDYEQTRYRLRPSHADYTAYEKYLAIRIFGAEDISAAGSPHRLSLPAPLPSRSGKQGHLDRFPYAEMPSCAR